MKTLFRTRTVLFGALAVTLGAASGAVLAAHSINRAAPLAAISVSFAGHHVQGQAEASPEPAESPEADASPEPEATETPEAAEPAEAAEAAEAGAGAEAPEPEADQQPEEHPTPAPTATSAASTETFSLTGGTVTLSCPSSGAITLDSASPNAGFSFEQGTEDGGGTIEVRFESSSHESRLQADCSGGQVQVLELREEAS